MGLKHNKSFIGLADIYGRLYAAAGSARPFGSIDKADLSFEEDVRKDQNYGRDGGILNTSGRLTDVVLTLSFQSLTLDNLALAYRGGIRSEAAGTVTDEEHLVDQGGFVRLKGISQSSIVVTNAGGTITYDLGVHYKPGGAGIQILDGASAGKPAIANGSTIKVSHEYQAVDIVEGLIAAQPELTLYFDGINEAEGNENVAVDLWRWKPNLIKSLSMIGSGYARAEIAGSLLLDPTQTLPGRSKFFRWANQKAAA